MKISEFKKALSSINSLHFFVEKSNPIPSHFHITEVGESSKRYIDCGGVIRNEKCINMQLWHANDFEHRLTPKKVIDILELSEKTLQLEDLEIEVEYQSETIGIYTLCFEEESFVLKPKQTDCLDKDKCGIPPIVKQKVSLSNLNTSSPTCTPGSGCC